MLPYIHIGSVQIPMYGLMMATAMLTSVFMSYFRSKKRGASGDKLLTIAIAAIICGIFGAKLLYLFVTYSWSEIVGIVRDGGIIALLQEGLVFYGGLIGGVAGAFLGAKIGKVKLSEYSDAVVPTLPLAHAIGRIGCFCAGCCYGKVTDSWIGMSFPDLPAGQRVIPTQLIESGANLIVFAFLIWFTLRRRKGFTTLFVYLIIYGVERFFLEFLRGDEIRGIFGAFSTSQWISLLLIEHSLIGLFITNFYEKVKGRKLRDMFVGEPLVPAEDIAEPLSIEAEEKADEPDAPAAGAAEEKAEVKAPEPPAKAAAEAKADEPDEAKSGD